MFIRLLNFLFKKQFSWRLGRSLYMRARGDIQNDIKTNGELMVQRCVVDGWRQTGSTDEKLVIFDVGANVGNWSEPLLAYVTASHVSTRCDLHLFEPIPDTLAVLQSRLETTESRTALHYHQVALSSANGDDQMYLLGAAGINSIHSDKVAGKKPPSISIWKDTVFKFCANNAIQEIHLLKCDTEGHDMEVIHGALPLLKQDRIKVLQFEYNHRWIFSRHYLKDVFDIIASLPYRLGKVRSDYIELYSEWHPELERFFEANYIIIHQDSLMWFSTQETFFDVYNTLRTKRP